MSRCYAVKKRNVIFEPRRLALREEESAIFEIKFCQQTKGRANGSLKVEYVAGLLVKLHDKVVCRGRVDIPALGSEPCLSKHARRRHWYS